jgi:hypothetical protein
MLTPEYLDGLAAPLQERFSELQTVIQTDIARRIAKADYTITGTAAWQIRKLQELGESQANIQAAIAKTLNMTDKEVKTLFKAAGIKSLKPDMELQKAAIKAGKLPAGVTPITASAAVAQVLNANAILTMNTLRNLTRTIAQDASGKLNQYLDMAQLMVQSGAYTQEQAIDTTVKKFAADGVNYFDYMSGARISIEAGVRRAVVTGVNQATAKISLNNAAELETDLVEVTSHADARPDHAEWQGGIYSISGTHPKYRGLREATGYGTVTGLCGANCRHSFYAYIEGVSEQVPKERYDPDTYEAEQEQRYHERMIRSWKRRAATLEAGGADNTKELLKVREWQNRLQQHLDKTGLARISPREQVPGFGKKLSAKAVAAEKKHYADMVKLLGEQKAPSSFDQYKDLKYNKPEEFKGIQKEYKTAKQEQWARQVIEENSNIAGYKVFSSADDIPQWAKDQVNNWSPEEKAALSYYTAHDFSSINGSLRGKTVASSFIQEKIDKITSAIEKTDIAENIVTWRGTGLVSFDQSAWLRGTPLDAWSGAIISDKAFASTSMLKGSAFTDEPVFLQILVPAGSKGAYLSPISRFENEYEMLFQHGSSFMILEAKEENGKTFIKVLYQGGEGQ